MEDKIDKLLDMMEKMYVDLKGDIKGLQEGQNKLQITQEQTQSKLEQIAEIQQSHHDENKRSHNEMIRRIERIGVATMENEAEIHNLKKAK